MYYTHTKYPVMSGEPHLGTMIESELIEADGEVEDIWMERTIDLCYAERYLKVKDDITGEDIDIDITDYIGLKGYRLFDSVLMYMDEDEELTESKFDSWLTASIMQVRRQNRKARR